MSGKIYFHEFAAAAVPVHNRHRARFDFEMLRQRGNDGIVGTAILRRLANFDDQHPIGPRCQADFFRARDDFYWKSHTRILAQSPVTAKPKSGKAAVRFGLAGLECTDLSALSIASRLARMLAPS